jgi:hypothetical protein
MSTTIDQLVNDDKRNALGIFPLYKEITEHRHKWKIDLQMMEQALIPFQAYKYHPSCRRDIGGPKRRWKET